VNLSLAIIDLALLAGPFFYGQYPEYIKKFFRRVFSRINMPKSFHGFKYYLLNAISGLIIGYGAREFLPLGTESPFDLFSKAENETETLLQELVPSLEISEEERLLSLPVNSFLIDAEPLPTPNSELSKRVLEPFQCFILVEPKTSFVVASKQVLEADPNYAADFLCDGDNDQVEIQSAILNLASATEKRVVELTAGTFVLNDQLVLDSNMILKGAGREQTILILQNDANPFRQAGMLRGFHLNGFEISDLTINGNKAGQTSDLYAYLYGRFGFYCEVCINMVLRNMIVTEFYGYGLDPHGEPVNDVYSDGLIIENVISTNNGWDGMTIDKTLNTRITNSRCEGNGRHGINLVTGTKYTVIENNVIINNGWNYKNTVVGNGITVQDNESFGTGHSTIRNNLISLSGSRGIRIDTNCHDDFIQGNVIDGDNDCIYAKESINLRIDRNNCVNDRKIKLDISAEGILITNSGRIQLPDGTNLRGQYP
jgi:hypothetical protein